MKRNKVSWWYLSFAGTGDVWLGAAIVRGLDFDDALAMVARLKIVPEGEGEVCGGRFQDEEIAMVPEDLRNRLLSRADLEKAFGELMLWPHERRE